MKKTLRNIGSGLLLLLVAYIALCIFGTQRISVSRSTIIPSPAPPLFDLVNQLEQWVHWSPWHLSEPTMQITYGPVRTGTGASYTWKARHSGSGQLQITESTPPHLIRARIQLSNFGGYTYATYTFEPRADRTTLVTCTMKSDADIPFLLRGLASLMALNKAIGHDVEQGLNNLKTLCQQ